MIAVRIAAYWRLVRLLSVIPRCAFCPKRPQGIMTHNYMPPARSTAGL